MMLFDKIFIGCKQATYLHEKRKSGKTGPAENSGLWLHLLYCKFCRLFIKQVEQLEIYTHRFAGIEEKKNAFNPERKLEFQKAFNEALKDK